LQQATGEKCGLADSRLEKGNATRVAGLWTAFAFNVGLEVRADFIFLPILHGPTLS
jgi:hypothetical protein